MVAVCILSILLYGAENWCLSESLLQVLNSFLGEVSKRLAEFTSTILCGDAESPRDIKDEVMRKDQELLLTKHEDRVDVSLLVKVQWAVGWLKLWDLALDNGPKCVNGLKNMCVS